MSRYIKFPGRKMQDVKKNKIILSAAAITVILLLSILTIAVVRNNGKISKIDFIGMTNSVSASNKVITVNPHPYYNVTVNADGQTYSVKATGTVADAINAAGIKVDDNDLINIGLNEPLNRRTSISINRVDIIEEVRLETIEYATQYQEDDDYFLGYSEVVVDGEEGELEKLVHHVYVDGRLTSSQVVSTEVTEEPVNEVIVLGTSEVNPIQEMSISQLEVPDYLALDENGAPTSYTAVYTGKACAYSAKPTAKTASGRTVKVGYVAVDPSLIPYGTELYIASTDGKHIYGYAIAADTGTGLLEGVCLVDLFMESYEASCEWGAKQVNVYVLN